MTKGWGLFFSMLAPTILSRGMYMSLNSFLVKKAVSTKNNTFI